MKKFRTCILSMFFCMAMPHLQAQTKVIAHRGFWNTEGSAQNSLTSLRKAAEARLYGSEFDVQMTADSIIVVNHDNAIGGYIIEKTPYSKIKSLKIKNGEYLPTLQSYLKEAQELDIRLILEIKPHSTKTRDDVAVKKIVNMVRSMGLEKQTEYISFSMNICERLVEETLGQSEIFYLNGDMSPLSVKAKGLTGIDYHYKVFQKNPEWIKEAHDCGLKVNTWTVNQENTLKKMVSMNVDFITTDNPLEATKIITENK